jgi:Holliday junction resolvase-like predicted endonuclease
VIIEQEIIKLENCSLVDDEIVNKNKLFINYNMDSIFMSPYSFAFLGRFSCSMHFPSNSILLNGIHPTQDQMAEALGVGRTILNSVLKELELNNVIKRQKTFGKTYIFVNPFIISHGYVAKDTFDMFKKVDKDQYFYYSQKEVDEEEILPEHNIAFDRNLFTEKELENALIYNLDLIEDGMTFIKNQYTIEGGYIDILAKDKNNKTCIIELKIVDNCKDIIYQSVYYPTQFNEEVRMITIAPDYSKKIAASLSNLKYVEMLQYNMDDENKLTIKKYKS